MSGSIVDFQHDSGTDAVLRGLDAGMRARKARQDVGVDAAIRQGAGTMLDRGGSAGYQAPGQDGSAPDYSAIMLPGASSQAAPAAPPAPAPASSSDTTGAPNVNAGRVISTESSGNPGLVNRKGYSGLYQFGTGLLRDAGVYQPAQGEDMTKNQWAGTINLPLAGQMTQQQFLQNPAAQHEARAHAENYLRGQQTALGMDKYVGQTVGGVAVTPESLLNMQWIGGSGGAQKFLTSGGAYNPPDANGTTIGSYAQKTSGAPGAPPIMAPGSTMPGGYMGQQGGGSPLYGPANPGFNARYDPILQQLAQTPGGGAPILQIMQGQSRYDMAQGRRADTYARLAMTAAARGDVSTAQYYAGVAGMKFPPNFGADAAMTRKLGVASLLAERLGRDDPAWSQRFTQAYLSSGDAVQALQQVGQPRDRVVTTKMLFDEESGLLQAIGITKQGAAVPITGPDGKPVTASPAPANTIVQSSNGPVVVNRNAPAPTGQAIMAPGGGGAALQAPPKSNPTQQKYDMLTKGGMDPKMAALMAGGQKAPAGVKPSDVLATYRSMMNMKALDPEGQTMSAPEWDSKRVGPLMDQTFGSSWRAMVATPSAPAGAAAPPAAPAIMTPGASSAPPPQAPAAASRFQGIEPAQQNDVGGVPSGPAAPPPISLPPQIAAQLKKGVGREITGPDGAKHIWTLDEAGAPKMVR